MKEHIRGVHLANMVRMRRTQDSRTALLVEGDDDKRLFARHVDPTRCLVCTGYGRPKVLDALAILERDGVSGILAIIDADSWTLGGGPLSPNLIMTEWRDMEVVMVSSPALDRVLIEYGDEELLIKFSSRHGTVRDCVFRAAAWLGVLRIISEQRGLGLHFDALDLSRIVDERTLQVSVPRLIAELQNCSGVGVIAPEIQDAAVTFHSGLADLRMCCAGHDVIGLVGIGLQRAFGSRLPMEVKRERMEAAFRLAFENADLRTTKIWTDVEDWERRNAPYTVWRR